MEFSLSTILRENIQVTGAGRTDTGVHAAFYILHFDSAHDDLDKTNLPYRLNSLLPDDIAVQEIRKVANHVHARFDAVSRTYRYYISKAKNPFKTEYSFIYTRPLDVGKMNEAASVLFEYEDFTSFSKLHTDVKTNNCRIYQAHWELNGDDLIFTIKADRFLRNMVRAIVGTLLDVGKGKISVGQFRQIIEKKDRGEAGSSAPAQGLVLTGIEYPEDIYIL